MDEFALGVAAGLSFSLVLLGVLMDNIIGTAVITVGIIAFMGSILGLHINRTVGIKPEETEQIRA